MDYRCLKGTHDIIGIDAMAYDDVELAWKDIAVRYGFKPTRTPTMEMSELFTRSVGSGSDIVRKEMYTFLDKGGRSVSLRPEHTASIVRSFVNNKLYATEHLPYKVFYCGPAFRYERPQKGRLREFIQFGVESLGVKTAEEDADVILMAVRFFEEYDFPYVLKINYLGSDASRANYVDALKKYVLPHLDTMCTDCKERYTKNPLRMLDCKVEEDKEILKDAPKIKDFLSKDDILNYDTIKTILDNLDISYVEDDNLVRGLDYYSGIVFEIYLKDHGDFGAILAGGHYDHLVNEIGGPSLSSVGFSFGVDRFISFLKEEGRIGNEVETNINLIIPLGEDEKVKIAALIYRNFISGEKGIPCDISLQHPSISSAMKYASKAHYKNVIIIGDDEFKNDTVTIKKMDDGIQVNYSKDEFINRLEEILFGKRHHCCHHEEDGEHECHCHHEEEEKKN